MKVRSAVASAIVAVTAVSAACLIAGYATADPPVLTSGDDRATVHTGNVTGADCPTLFPGSVEIPKSDIVSSSDGTYVTVSAVDVKWFVFGFVVKGGDGYNLYPSSATSSSDMHAPVGPSGGPAGISHWFACGLADEETTTETTTSDTTTETTVETTTETTETTTDSTTSDATTTDATTTSESTTSSVSTTTDPSTSVSTSDSSSVVVLTDSNSASGYSVDPTKTESLAYTGVKLFWLVLAALVLIGGGILAVLFARRRKSKVS